MRISDHEMRLVHPAWKPVFKKLADILRAEAGQGRVLFLPFETYRTPMRQAELLGMKTTKAGPMQSPHQYGLAVDFVPFVDGRWTWDVPAAEWRRLKQRATECGLAVPISWDKAHVEVPTWAQIRQAMMPPITYGRPDDQGSTAGPLRLVAPTASEP